MGIKGRLVLMNFLQFFIWGSWLISLGNYMGASLGFSGIQIGGVYTTMGIASLFMPGLLGIVADRWINAERLLGLCHLIGAVLMLYATTVTDYFWFYIIMLLNACMYMPTIALNNSVSYNVLEKKGYSIVTDFPPIRVWGTIGFIAAMWTVDFLGYTQSAGQLYVGAASALLLGFYAFTMPPSPPLQKETKKSLMSTLGLDAFVLFKQRKMAVFFIFAMLLGAALQITNAFGGPFLEDFKTDYPDSFGVQHPNLLLSISQVSETVFILLIPFFLKRYGIKTVMLFSILAWVFRFGLFGIGNPDDGLWLLVLSMIIYGMAFDFFNISGSMFVEKEADPTIRSSAQGLFMIMTNGIGAFVGGLASGWVVDHFTENGIRNWQYIWFTFAGYALVLAIIFPFVFKVEKGEMVKEE
ncbi:MFS transporter [Flavobacterium rakeshii]|uniref:MFS transporter n=1 Tax=Flavobacterium rakeshii TaxID=1038845 RepID=A0A6N8HD47_9FLAO|nr:nucleoside permease [Flavobacterium rakeshii]MEE1900186.1 nucleoside permease [Flavobacterium rakeshii]MUV04222.1 MFS transporter [Flavobacterium rakeshii]